jgi:hypothetical protein
VYQRKLDLKLYGSLKLAMRLLEKKNYALSSEELAPNKEALIISK